MLRDGRSSYMDSNIGRKKVLYLLKTAHVNPRSYSASMCSQYLTEDVSPEVKQPGHECDSYRALMGDK